MSKPKCMMAAGEHLNAGRYASKPCFALNEHGCCEILTSLPAWWPSRKTAAHRVLSRSLPAVEGSSG